MLKAGTVCRLYSKEGLTMSSTRGFADRYLKWFTDNTHEEQVGGGWSEIGTPFLDRFGDGIAVYVKEQPDHTLLLTDDYALTNNTIGVSGPIESRKLQALRNYLSPYGIEVTDDGELQMETIKDNYPIKFNLFIQAIVAANDMFAPRSARNDAGKIFIDEVVSFFEQSDIAYSPNVKIEGQSGIIHQVGFLLPKRKKVPERFIYALNKPSKQNVELTLFNWSDIQRKRGTESRMFTFLNDKNGKIADNLVQALESYEALPILWSKRGDYLEELAV